ncbi:MAG: hypothetical protein ACR2LM_09435 [Pyrinomonadaceae bacterium]
MKLPLHERGELLDSHAQATGLAGYYNISGQLLRVQAHGDWEAKWVAAFFNGFYLNQTAVPAGSQPAITLSIKSATSPSILPACNPSLSIMVIATQMVASTS